MSRAVPYRRTISDLVSWRQDQALNATIFILRETGPTGYLLQEEGVSKKFKAFLGERHSCTCPEFRKDNDLCKHLCWILLRKFRIPRQDPLSWQIGLVERELDDLLYGGFKARQQASKRVTRPDKSSSNTGPASDEPESGQVAQRPLSEEDVCPICQDELLEARLPVTYCKYSCGNSVHLRCMRVYWEHERQKTGITAASERLKTEIICPICRGNFGPASLLMREIDGARAPAQPAGHAGSICAECNVTPIRGKLYKCDVCTNFLLCQRCFNTPTHQQHRFIFRERPHQSWKQATRILSNVPNGLLDSLQNRELTSADYDMLLQLDRPADGNGLREQDLKLLPSWRVRPSSKYLAPGQQCRLCLQAYRRDQLLRRLPGCGHSFHAECLDPFLIHRSASCPLDGQAVEVKSDRPRRPSGSQAVTNAEGTNENAAVGLILAGQACRSAGPGETRGMRAAGRRLPPLPPRGAGASIAKPFSMGIDLCVGTSQASTSNSNHVEKSIRQARSVRDRTSFGRSRSHSNSRRRSLPERTAAVENSPTDKVELTSALDLHVTGVTNNTD